MSAFVSQTQYGKTEQFYLQLARNQIQGHKFQFKFGYNPTVTTAETTVWTQGGVYAYQASAIQLKISSSSANDTAAGTGARTISVQGLDSAYNEISETVTLNGQTPVLTANNFLRVNRMFVIAAGSGNTAAGTIYAGDGTVTAGVPATVYAVISLGENQTLMAIWTVPAGYTGYLVESTLNVGDAGASQSLIGRLMQRQINGVFRTVSKIVLHDGTANFDGSTIPLTFPEKTDIEIRATSTAGTNQAGANFALIYIKNSTD